MNARSCIVRRWVGRVLLLGIAAGLFGVRPAGAVDQLRGLWVDSFHPGFRTAAEVTQLVAQARSAGFNALFVEVRRRGDAFYASSLEPLAEEVVPGTDPLRLLLDAAHAEDAGPRLEVHAWVVAYNVWNQESRPPARTNHPFLLHPDRLTRSHSGAVWDGANYAWDPGLPEVQEHVFQVGMELVRRYEVDGLHLDYIRYAGPEWGYHPRSVARFNRAHGRAGVPAPTDPAWMQFRRDQVTALVRRLYLNLRAEKPACTLSAATIGFAPGITNSVQWPTSAAYSHVLQDWRAWMEEGILDWNLPMLYFRERKDGDEYTQWLRFVRGHQYRRQAAAGLAFYLNPLSATRAQILRAVEPVDGLAPLIGMCAYSYANLATDRPASAVFKALASPAGRRAEDARDWPAPPVRPPARPWKQDPATAHLMGTVRSRSAGGPVDGAEVLLVSGDARLQVTDACGFFGFVDAEPGTYTLTCTDASGASCTTRVTLRGGDVARVELELAADTAGNPGAGAGAENGAAGTPPAGADR